MKKSQTRSARSRSRLLLPIVAIGLALWLWPARPARSDNFVFYLAGSRQLVPIQMLDHLRYVPLIKVLGVVGTVSNVEEKRRSVKVWMSNSDRLELHEGDRKLKLNREDIRLGNPVRLGGTEWLVPIDFVYSVLPRLTTQPMQYRAGEERIFVGDLKPLTFSANVSAVPNGARLRLQFSDPVTTQTASTNGQYVIFLGDRALEPLEAQIQFQNQYVTSIRFDDQDGVPKLIVSPGAPGLNFYPSTSDQGRLFEADITQPAPAQTAQSAPAANATAQHPPSPGSPAAAPGPGQAPVTAATAPGAALQAAAALPPPLPVVVLDPGHGGLDAGARSRDGVSERDLTASLVDLARAALVSSGKVRVVLTRTGSSDPSADERDAIANLARPVAFITFHAGDLGGATPAVEVYTYQAPSVPAPSESPRTLFVPWTEAQQAHLVRSHDFAGLLVQQLGHVAGLETRSADEAPERQLRSIDAPAVAVEIGTLDPSQDAAALASGPLQNQIAAAVAQAVTALAQGAS